MLENENYSKEKFNSALKLRTFWKSNLQAENMKLKALLSDAFFPYQSLMQQELKFKNVDSDYEIDSYVCIKDEPRFNPAINDWIGGQTKSYVEISLYFMPKNLDNDDDIDIPQIFLTHSEQQAIEKLVKKFSLEIGMETRIIYE